MTDHKPRPSMPLFSFLVTISDADAAAETTLQSCVTQSLQEIEIVCVCTETRVPATTEWTRDPRIRMIVQPTGTSNPELRRAGLEGVRAPFVLVVEAGDRVRREAAARIQRAATESGADLVGFTVEEHGERARSRLVTPAAREALNGVDVVRQLVPRDRASALEPWRVAFRTELLRQSYAAVPTRLVDDRAIILLSYTAATSYVSVESTEYEHRPEVGGDPATPTENYQSSLGRVEAFQLLEPEFRERARFSANPEPMLDAYEASYLTTISETLRHFMALSPDLRIEERGWLRDPAFALDAVLAAVTLAPDLLPGLVAESARIELCTRAERNILLTTNVLTTGGVSGVLLTQARLLLQAGHRVTIATHRAGSAEELVPDGATMVQLTGTTTKQRVEQWARLCREREIDIVIDHRILYSRDWPAFALAARVMGSATIGWIHNFAGRPTYNGNDLQTLLASHLEALAHLVVLSPLDVAFWKLRGISHVSYLPNPPSPFLLNTGRLASGRIAPAQRRAELVWWGRLEEHTKKVSHLVEVAAALRKLDVNFRLRIVGPDWAGMSAESLRKLSMKRGVEDAVIATGPLHGGDLLEVIDSSDVFVNTSIIEGYPLTLAEAQARGLPIAMYDLPWLPLIHQNPGVITTPQQAPEALAIGIADLLADPSRFEEMSRASIAAAAQATSYNFGQLYNQLMGDQLPPEYSPEPTLEDGKRILELLVFFAERGTITPRAAAKGTRARRRRRHPPRTIGERLERRLTPLGHRVLGAAAWLRPAARTIKGVLLLRS